MKRVLLLITLLTSLLAACGDNEQGLNIATYSHEVNDGYMYTDQQGNDVFIDKMTLDSARATTKDKLNITYDSNGYEIESIEVVEVN
ncbi:hypothetical protein M3649_04035 [Ureibacillus chungkukjangi]|uniref:hypothetical protein n=1 Tax=Ureibacillus chungkukjangi TaxID=1202712 RepID=UPI00203F770F|nr:hypothetical protein [Ureibacillus chungkukjangi]MCM3387302.1 hypothetical protein [Ureibacillus chungkukjangi]